MEDLMRDFYPGRSDTEDLLQRTDATNRLLGASTPLSLREYVDARLGLIGFGLCVYRFGIGWHLFGFALLFGPVSMLLSFWRDRAERQKAEERLRLVPFSSVSELRSIRKKVLGFSKKRYPASARIRRVRGRLMTMALWLQTIVIWSFISPLVLLFQTLPEKHAHTRVCQ